MALDLLNEKGIPLDKQIFTWRELVQPPISKLDDDAFTRVRIILMNGIESEALRFSHITARSCAELRRVLADIRRVEQHQETMVNWLLPADQSPLETTIGYEQVAIEVTASLALNEPDEYLAQTYRFGMLEDFDHMYRYSALLDRLEGKDSNNILQCYTDVMPGRPTCVEHRMPEDNLRRPYDRKTVSPVSKLNTMTLVAAEYQTHDYYMNIGPLFSDPVARQVYAEIASIEEQHVTQYESLTDPSESPIEKWLLHECTEVYNYYSCMQSEPNPHIKAIWERFLDYELGHLALAKEYFQKIDKRDPAEVLPKTLPDPIGFTSHRDFVREVLSQEVDMRARGTEYCTVADERPDWPSVQYRNQMNRDGSPTELVAAGYHYRPGTELAVLSMGGKK